MENTATTINEPFNRFSIPIKWGVIWGILSCVLMTVEFMFFSDSYIVLTAGWLMTFLLGVVFYLITGFQQRKAMGGYITLKDAFQPIFIVILISSALSSIYGFFYFKYIDPDAMERMGATVISFMEKVDAPQESIDSAVEGFEKGAEDAKSVGAMALNFLKGIIISSIIGFICAAIVKKKKPEFGA
jgi:hypothetical protein